MIPPRWHGDWDLSSSSPASRHVKPAENWKQLKLQSRSTRLNSRSNSRVDLPSLAASLSPQEKPAEDRLSERETAVEKPSLAKPTWGPTSRSAPQFHEPGAVMLWVVKPVWFVLSNQGILMDTKHESQPMIYYRSHIQLLGKLLYKLAIRNFWKSYGSL